MRILNELSKLILLFSLLMASLVFTLVPSGIKIGFLLSDQVVSLEYYVYSVYQFIILIVLTGIIAQSDNKFKTALWVYFGLMCADLIDWIICYNEIWFRIVSFPVSMNIVKAFLFGCVILNEVWKNLTK